MRPSLEEQETHFYRYADEDFWHVYTSNWNDIQKFDKYVEEGSWKFIKQETCEGDIVSKDYTCPLGLIKPKAKKKALTEAQLAVLTGRRKSQ